MNNNHKDLRAWYGKCVAPAIVYSGLVSLAASLPFWAGCTRKPAMTVIPPDVEIAPVVRQDVPVQQEWIGTLDGLVHAHVHPQVSGYLMTRNYSEGRLVGKGDLMFEIDPRPFQATLDQALAKLGKDELDVKRLTPLAASKAISQQDLDDATQAYLGDKAAVEQARVNLDFTRVVSPVEGLSGLANAEVGDLVGPTSIELTTVTSIDPIKVYFSVSELEYLSTMERFATQLTHGETSDDGRFELILADNTVYPHAGRLYAADNQLSPRTGALRMTALFPNTERQLRPGQFARLRLTRIRHDALVVPQRSVSELQGNYQVSVLDSNNTVHVRAIQVGETAGRLWIVTGGLATGERVVVEGAQKTRDGLMVNPHPAITVSSTNSLSPPR